MNRQQRRAAAKRAQAADAARGASPPGNIRSLLEAAVALHRSERLA
jgi:hypothetical protein